MTESETPKKSPNKDQVNSPTPAPEFSFWNAFTQAVADAGAVVDIAANQAGKVISDTTVGLSQTVNQINTVSTQTSEAILKTVNEINHEISTVIQEVTPHTNTLQTKAQELGGGFAGAIAGETVGGVIGGIAGTAVLGPVGTVVGSQMGSFIGFIIGAQVGEEIIVQLNQATKPKPFEERLQTSLQIRAGDRIGDTVGTITGGIVGAAVLGPPGALIGSSIGGAFVGRLGEDTVMNLSNLGKTGNLPKTQPGNIQQGVTTWFGSATNEFVGETMVMTFGSIVGGIVLGVRGQRLGRQFGNFVGKKIDWDFNPIAAFTSFTLSQLPIQPSNNNQTTELEVKQTMPEG